MSGVARIQFEDIQTNFGFLTTTLRSRPDKPQGKQDPSHRDGIQGRGKASRPAVFGIRSDPPTVSF